MNSLVVCLLVQSSLAFGVAGLLWPEKLVAFYGVLMFPWAASHRTVRANSLAAIGISILLAAKLIAFGF